MALFFQISFNWPAQLCTLQKSRDSDRGPKLCSIVCLCNCMTTILKNPSAIPGEKETLPEVTAVVWPSLNPLLKSRVQNCKLWPVNISTTSKTGLFLDSDKWASHWLNIDLIRRFVLCCKTCSDFLFVVLTQELQNVGYSCPDSIDSSISKK